MGSGRVTGGGKKEPKTKDKPGHMKSFKRKRGGVTTVVARDR